MHFNELWNSPEKLESLITAANWGIALTLLAAFTCTVVVIKAGGRKDELTKAENLHKAEHIAVLDKDNLTLRGQVATLEMNAADANKDLAGLQQAATDAKTTQQRVEIELAKQQAIAANAEKSLLELKEKLKGRRITESQKKRVLELTEGKEKGRVDIEFLNGDPEAMAFAEDLKSLLTEAGWTVSPVKMVPLEGDWAIGLSLNFQTVEDDPSNPQHHIVTPRSPGAHGILLRSSFEDAGIFFSRVVSVPTPNVGEVSLMVGHKP